MSFVYSHHIRLYSFIFVNIRFHDVYILVVFQNYQKLIALNIFFNTVPTIIENILSIGNRI